jgi:hypothetical protein
MATYSTTFSGQTTGANSTNFTDRYDAETAVSVENPAIGEQDSRVLQFGTGDSGWIFQSFDDVDGDANRDNCEILARYRISADDDQQAVVTARASGSGGSEQCYVAYINTDDFKIGRAVSGAISDLATTPTETFPLSHFVVGAGDDFVDERADEWHWCRFRVNGTGATVTLQAKWWRDGYDEPEDWTLEYSDTSASRITGAGWIGFSKLKFTGISYLDYLGVGTNGDTAPDPSADTSSTLRVTNTYAQALTQGGTARVTNTYAQALTQGGTARVTNTYAQALTQGGTARVTNTYAQVLRQTSVPAAATGQSIQCIIMT